MPSRSPQMTSDFEELLKIFNANEVKYLIVGGYAVMSIDGVKLDEACRHIDLHDAGLLE